MAQDSVLRSFLGGIIDYAGLFPPAELSLSETLRNYLADRESKYSWMLAKLILPESFLHDLKIQLVKSNVKQPIELSVLSSDPVRFLETAQLVDPAYHVKSIETKLTLGHQVDFIGSVCRACRARNISVFFELPDGPSNPCLQAIKAQNYELSGFKLRCGTTDPTTTPTLETIAQAIKVASQEQIPIKFTAGLHHPFRKFQPGFDGYMHGFFNVFFATLLAYAQQISEPDLIRILGNETTDVTITADQLSWLGYSLNQATVQRLRKSLVLSFGSCSFREPIEDLEELGWNAQLFSRN